MIIQDVLGYFLIKNRSNFLINNRMPSSNLDNKIPQPILFPYEPFHPFLKFLGPHALFVILVLVLINYLQGHTNVSF